MIVKVKEPIASEYPRMREGQLLFTYLHLAPDHELTRQLLDRKVTGVAYETITDRRGTLPLLTPMSEVAGRMAVQVGAHYLEKMQGGRGILLGGVPGVPAARVVIIGGGVVGTNSAKMTVAMGAHVTIIDTTFSGPAPPSASTATTFRKVWRSCPARSSASKRLSAFQPIWPPTKISRPWAATPLA